MTDAVSAPPPETADVVVVGGGNAGFTAALAAAVAGSRVVLLEKAPFGAHGGNSFYTAGATRVPFDDIADFADLLDDATHELLPRTVVPGYPAAAFRADLDRVTEGRNDPELSDVLIAEALPTVRWLHARGIRYRLMYERQAYETDGVFTFFGNLPLGVVGGGKGLIEQHTAAALAAGVEIRYGAEVVALLQGDDGAVRGVRYHEGTELHELLASSVVLAAGGFESSAARRREHLGEGWERAIVRGTPTNTGEVLDLAIAAGAQRFGDWGSSHSVAWDAGAPAAGGDRELTNQRTRQSYFLGIVVNRDGERFLDEGADFRNYTYARYGREILRQPGGIAYQVFDGTIRPMLRTEEYDSRPITEAQADTLEELADAIGIDSEAFVRTVEEFNAGIIDVPFQPAVKDGRASNVVPPKSNWALPIATPPFHAFAVACGITFTFGGVRVDRAAHVLREDGSRIPGLYAAGEMVGGLFSGNYPGGSGLTSGSVFGRLAGRSAAQRAADLVAVPAPAMSNE